MNGTLAAPGLSFVIVSWNGKGVLRDCLLSLRRERGTRDWEVLVVDNASTDGSPEMVEAEFPEVRLLRQGSNLGFARGNNLGIAAARGRNLCLVNSDVLFLEGSVDAMMRCLEDSPGAGLVGPLVLTPSGEVQPSWRRFPSLGGTLVRAFALDTVARRILARRRTPEPCSRPGRREVDVLVGCCWFVRREAIDEVGPLDEDFFMYAEDVEWSRRFARSGRRNLYCTEGAIVHLGGGSSRAAPVRFHLARHDSDLLYFRKHHSGPAQAAYLGLTALHEAIRLAASSLLLLVPGRGPREELRLKRERSLKSVLWAFGAARRLGRPCRGEGLLGER